MTVRYNGSVTAVDRAQRAAAISLGSTCVVVAIKLGAAYLSGSISVLAEGIQSIMDILMSLVAVGTVRYAAKPADDSHNYGHGKAEVLASVLQMLVILGSGIYILMEAVRRFRNPQPIEWDWGAIAMGYAVVANFLVAKHVGKVAHETGSAALASEALHLRGDILASAGVLLGMLAVGFSNVIALDPVAAIVFTTIAMVQAGRHLRESVHPLMDGSLPPDEVAKLEAVLKTHPQVRGYHNLRTRQVGSLRHVELHVMLDDDLSFVDAHDMAEHIEDDLKAALGGGLVSIHYEPYEAEVAHRRREHEGVF